MPGISVSKIPIPFRGAGGISWASYWATLISATVENAAPTHVVLTFPSAQTSLGASDFTIAGFTISSASWTGAVLTLVLSEAVLIFDEDLTITFVPTSETATVTNNVADDGNTLAWYDSSDLTTITKDVDDFVSLWKDKLLSGNDLKSALTLRPKWYLGEGILFDGSNDRMFSNDIVGLAQPTFIYIVVKQVTWTDGRRFFDGKTSNSGIIAQRITTPNIAANAGSYSTASSSLVLDTWAVIRVLFNGANSKFQIDEVAAITGNFGANDMVALRLGSAYDSASNSNIQVKEMIVRKTADAEAVETAIYNCLKKKNNLTWILDGGIWSDTKYWRDTATYID